MKVFVVQGGSSARMIPSRGNRCGRRYPVEKPERMTDALELTIGRDLQTYSVGCVLHHEQLMDPMSNLRATGRTSAGDSLRGKLDAM